MKARLLIVIIIATMSTLAIKAQYMEDALRLSQQTSYISPRAGALNVAFHGISDDYSALMYNPAGLSLIPSSELSVGMGFMRNSSETDFLGNIKDFNSNDPYLTHAGFVSPFKIKTGNAAIGVGYFLESNYDNNYSLEGINPASTMINHFATTGPDNVDENIATGLWLADDNFNTPIKNGLRQKSFVQESGGIHNITGGASFDLAEFVSAGFTISGKWGTFKYNSTYESFDDQNIYNSTDNLGDFVFLKGLPNEYTLHNIDFEKMEVRNKITQDISGITASMGIQGRIGNFMRFGASIKFPTFYEVNEEFSTDARAYFGESGAPSPDADRETYYKSDGKNSYKLTTPWVYSAGMSMHILDLTFSAGVEYSDVTQLEFSDAVKDIENINQYIIQELVGQVTWGVGVEYKVPLLPLIARASYASTTSPYVVDVPGASMDYVSIGGGILLSENTRLDGLFRWTSITHQRSLYGSGQDDIFLLTNSPLNISIGVTYRY